MAGLVASLATHGNAITPCLRVGSAAAQPVAAPVLGSTLLARMGALRLSRPFSTRSRTPLKAAVAMVDQMPEEEAPSAFADVEEEAPLDVVNDELDEGSPRSFASLMGGSETEAEPEVVDESLLLANCGLRPETVAALEARGIHSLFAVQKQVFTPAMDGSDLIARARTGSGKTLAFALPVVEKILEARGGARGQHGRLPQCIVLAPTRELAKQVEREIGASAPRLTVGCFYGGASMGGQLRELRQGVDVVVGTPGRVIDLIDQDALDLSQIRFVVLDEADQMLNVGFEKDVETILSNVPQERQTMLFSATMPRWVKKLVKTYLNDPITIDLVGEGNSGKMAESITALAVQVTDDTRRTVLVDLLTVYGAGGKAIVFTQTKREADEVSAAVGSHLSCSALHGDMSQREREKVLQFFRDNKLEVLVATDVAARGLDIPDVDLVVHYELPQDPEGFLHRSGRTGRAGREGTAIAMFTRKEIGYFKRILRETETTHVATISPPTPRQVVEAAAKQVMSRLDGVDPEIRDFFAPVARLVLSSRDPQSALETALAALSGIKTLPEPRSLITTEQGLVTMQVMSEPGRISRAAHIVAIVGRLLDGSNEQHLVNKIGRIRMLSEGDQEGAAFDCSPELAAALLARTDELAKRKVQLTQPLSLPPEEDLYSSSPRGSRDDDSSFFEQRRRSSGRGGSSYGRSSGGDRGGRVRRDGGWDGGRERSSGGGRRDGGSWERIGGTSFGRSSGEWHSGSKSRSQDGWSSGGKKARADDW